MPPRRPRRSAMGAPERAPKKVPIERSDVMRERLVEERQLLCAKGQWRSGEVEAEHQLTKSVPGKRR